MIKVVFRLRGSAIDCRRVLLRALAANRARFVAATRDSQARETEITLSISHSRIKAIGSINGAIRDVMLLDDAANDSVECLDYDCYEMPVSY